MGGLQSPGIWLILLAVVVVLFVKKLPDAARRWASRCGSSNPKSGNCRTTAKPRPSRRPPASAQPPMQVQSERVEAPLAQPQARTRRRRPADPRT